MTDQTNDPFGLPVGTVVNASLFERDTFVDATGNSGKPSYKVEIAFERGALDNVADALMAAADAEWGEGAGDDDTLIWPILDGDKLAEKREKRGKNGDAYKGKDVIRANTMFNADGKDAPGGISLYHPDLSKMDPVVDQKEIYGGIKGSAGVSIGTYHDDRFDRNGLKFYLSAFQKTEDGERIGGTADHSGLFTAVGRKDGETTKRTRKG
tara:strand:+ start:545 stop:1174 length:630 start_codon:yes stop_codon:yes gene_type:complete